MLNVTIFWISGGPVNKPSKFQNTEFAMEGSKNILANIILV